MEIICFVPDAEEQENAEYVMEPANVSVTISNIPDICQVLLLRLERTDKLYTTVVVIQAEHPPLPLHPCLLHLQKEPVLSVMGQV